MDNNIGKKIDGRYEITELIGIGGMADVYKAVDLMENKVVAVKILKTEFASNEDFQRRFRNESKAIAVLSHPNIVKIFDVGFTDKLQYIVMEYIDGVTLKEYLEQQGAIKPKDAVHFTIQILRALQHAHDRGIVHRDIKPQNIMLFSDGTIKVMDFGIARFSRQEGKTLSDKTIGSVHYISPEQARGDVTDEKSDIYSVGAMLFEMMTGEKPFEADTPVAVALMHMQDPVRLPTSINPDIPKGIEEIILHAMQKDPDKRYQSASEMIKDFEAFKLNPDIVFGYGSANAVNPDVEGSTIFFKPLADADTNADSETEDDKALEEKDEEESEKASWLVPVITGVTVTVVVVATIIICTLLMKTLKNDNQKTIKLPNFVGSSYEDVKKEFGNTFQFEVTEENSDEYEKGIIMSQDPSENRVVAKNDKIKLVVSSGKEMGVVPDVKNKPADLAKSLIEEAGFVASPVQKADDDIPSGTVISTDPAEFTKLEKGSTVTYYVSIGPTSNAVTVPNVVGDTEEKAKMTLSNLKLRVNAVPISSSKPKGTVVSQSLAPNSIAKIGDDIIIRVSTGEISEQTVNIKLPIKKGSATGKFRIIAYVDSNAVATKDIDKIEYSADTITIPVKAAGESVTVIFDISCLNSNAANKGKETKYASVVVDFTQNSIGEFTIYDAEAFTKAAKPVTSQGNGSSQVTNNSSSTESTENSSDTTQP